MPRCAEVFEERGVGLVVHRADDVAHALDRGERLRAVDVPGDLVEHGQEGVDRDEPHAALDQPPREQAALAEPRHAVALAGDGRFSGEVERLARLRAGHQPEGRLEVAVQERSVFGRFERGDGVVDELADLATAVEPDGADLLGRQQVGHPEIGLRRIGVERERVVGFAEEAAGLAVGQVAAAATHQLGQHDERRQVGLAAAQVGDRRADVRRIDAAGEQPARLHHLPAGVVHRRAAVMNRPHQRELVGDRGHAEAGSRRAGSPGEAVETGLNGPRISAGASGFMSQRSMLLGAPRLKIMMQARSSSPGLTRPGRLGGEPLRQAEADRPERACLQEVAATDPVARECLAFPVDFEHAKPPELYQKDTVAIQCGLGQCISIADGRPDPCIRTQEFWAS